MTSRNRTLLFRKYRNSLRNVQASLASSSLPTATQSGVGPVIEMASTSLLNPSRSYAPVSTDDLGNSSKKRSFTWKKRFQKSCCGLFEMKDPQPSFSSIYEPSSVFGV